MVFRVLITCWVLIVVVFAQESFHVNNYEFKNLSEISTEFKRIGEFFLENEKYSEQEPFRDELMNDLSISLEICQRGLDEAARKVGSLLELISPDEFSEVKASDQELNDEDNLYEHPEIEIIVEDLSETKTFQIKEKDPQKELYFKDFEKLLQTFNNACSSLPRSLPTLTSRRTRSPEKIAKRLALSLKKWAEKWLGHVESKLDTFLDSCLKNDECEHYLQKAFKLFIEALKENKYNLDEDTLSIFKDLQRSSYKGNPSVETLNDIQRFALTIGDPLDTFGEGDNTYHIAGAVNGLENHKDLLENQGGVNPVGIISNLFRFQSVEKLKKGVMIEIEEKNLVTRLPPNFLSVAFGSSIIQEGWGEVKAQKEKFKKIASALSPSILRVGGSAANFLSYNPSSNKEEENEPTKFLQNNKFSLGRHPKIKPSIQDHQNLIPGPKQHQKGEKRKQYKIETNQINYLDLVDDRFDFDESCQPQFNVDKNYKNFTMTGNDWKFLVELVRDLKWELVFDLNQFWRTPEGHWNPTNAELIINDPQSSTIPIIWQLGNEPNSYHHKFNFSIPPEEAARDYRILAEVTKGIVIGPDVTRPKHLAGEFKEDSIEYLRRFLEAGDANIDFLTWHQYYIDGKTATLENFLSTEILNAFPAELHKIVSTRDRYAPRKPIWITETATAWEGGAPGLSDRFVGCFPWLDKLGAAALGGVSAVFRQTLYGGCYSLLDHQLDPNPDFWVSVLHKNIVGEGVLLPRVRLASDSTRIYAHCLNFNHHMFQKGAIVIFGINLSGENERLKLKGKKLKQSTKYLYELSAPQGDLRSREILLNGNILTLSEDGSLPEFQAVEIRDEGLNMSPYTLNFWVLPTATVDLC